MATGSINISSNISRNTLLENYPPKPCLDLTSTPKNEMILLRWTDPDDYVSTDNKEVKWKYTIVVRKTGSYPINEKDGTIVVTSSIRNQYKNTDFIDKNLVNNTTYYYRAFSCSADGVFNREPCECFESPVPYKKMTVNIDMSVSSSTKTGTYADDASNMGSGKDSPEWTSFFGYRPCLFKDGKVVGYLNPNDFTKFENGSVADITSGNAGDVMIEFPRRGLNISVSGNILTVSMTDNPDDSNYSYYAHNKGSESKDYFYIGAYPCKFLKTLASISGVSITHNEKPEDQPSATLWSFTSINQSSKNKGTGYSTLGFYQYTFIQAMYLLQYKGVRDIQRVHGIAYKGGTTITTGHLNTSGMMYGDDTYVKLFGIEDIYGRWIHTVLTGVYISINGMICTSTDVTADVPSSSYAGTGITTPTYNSGYIKTVFGTNILGFLPKTAGGSTSTYFADYSGKYYNGCGISIGGQFSGTGSNPSYDYGLFEFNPEWYMPELGGSGGSQSAIHLRLQYL